MISIVTMKLNVDDLIISALKEDITSEDISANSVIQADAIGTVDLIIKQNGVLAGLQVFERVFTLLDGGAVFETSVRDGDVVAAGALAGRLTGNMRALLSGERVALNFLQRMSGIATLTRRYADILRESGTKLVDTRKTTPGLRILEKYAVKAGGAENHRYNLSDAILLKDNHIAAAGGVRNAVERARKYAPFVSKIEIETESAEMVQEALDAGADIIMLDNMDDATMKDAVRLIGGRAKTECSGNVTEERLREIAEIGVDYVSSGALTHSCGILDISMKNMRPLG
ncbi:MAG: carboxylating nicotinate-nucleotide diphosphorylase [Synergistaceae bacterium]|jgi:nicotinate-nucleotide pyrophosphorylase (carboxylating)|nr:carboxylating nicotinate-nucleotide diphosphorylase [Synergistaceae bacterium]